MESVNDRLLHSAIDHAIDLRQYSDNVVRRMIGILNRSDARLFAELTQALESMGSSAFSIERLESLLYSVSQVNSSAYAEMQRELSLELRDFASYESSYQAQALQTALPVQIHVATLTGEQVYTAAMAQPFQGGLLSQWASEQEATVVKRIRRAVAQGYVEGKTTEQIIREVRGTRAAKYADGIMEIGRREASAVVRTAVSHMAGFTQDRMAEANDDLIKAVTWVATLDNKTSAPCRLRDGLQYKPVTHKPIGHSYPWGAGPGRYHWNCRSAQSYVTKSWAELGGAANLPELTGSQRASMDGAVPKDTTYAQWLNRQSAARQDEVLGPNRGKLLRSGGLSLDDMYSARGKPLTLDELRAKDAEAFKKAGL